MEVVKKQRVFGLDFVRAVATVLIVMTHYNARYIMLGDQDSMKKMIVTGTTFNVYIGSLGVSLFLMISGAALMLTYENNFEKSSFYKKRFVSIYPMFWLAYIVAFFHQFYVYRGINQSIPKYNIILSIIGLDGYLSNAGIPTFYILGEWFLGFIIIIYIIFPILRKGVLEYPFVTAMLTILLYIVTLSNYKLSFPQHFFLFTRIPEVLFGMYFQRYIKKVNRVMAIIALGILLANTVIAPNISSNFQTTYVGIAAFLLFIYLGELCKKNNIIVGITKVLCKYSYAIFLVHHYIIAYVMGKFDLNNITILESYILFVLICCMIGIFARLLYDGNKYIFKKMI